MEIEFKIGGEAEFLHSKRRFVIVDLTETHVFACFGGARFGFLRKMVRPV